MSMDVRYMKLKTIFFYFLVSSHTQIFPQILFFHGRQKLKFYCIFFIILSIASRIDVNKKTESQITVLGSSYF